MIDALFTALQNLLSIQHLSFMMLGVVLGMVVGVLPGLGGIVGLSLLLPFIHGMDQTSALAMLIGLVAVIATSDTFPSILMGIPGSSASQATVLDGFPLAKKGEAARALAAGLSASLLGGVFGALVLSAFVVVARPLILAFSSGELFMLSLFGLSMVGVLSGANLPKGLAAAALGMALGAVGAAPATGEYRMDFDSLYLIDGIPLVIVALGLFAIPEMVDLMRSGGAISQRAKLGKGMRQGIRDTLSHPWLVLRCSALGALIGAIPGLGGSVVDWIAYGHVVQTSRDRSLFGKGDIRGVIAPESANNAKEGGGLIPTLMFAIPGSGGMAVFLAGLVLLGIQPGPSMASTDLDITYTIVWTLAIANIAGATIGIFAAPAIARLTVIRYVLIAPFMVMIITFAAFQATRSLSDLVALLIVGTVGVLLRRFGWPRPAFLIGFVLSTQSERFLYQALQFHGWEFLTRPLSLAIFAVTVISIYFGMRLRPGDAKPVHISTEGTSERADKSTLWPQVAFAVAIACGFAFVLINGLNLSRLGGVFPISIGIAGLIATAAILFQLVFKTSDTSANFDSQLSAEAQAIGKYRSYALLFWLAGFVVSVALVGYFLTLVGFFFVFLRSEARTSWPRTLILTACAAAAMAVLANALSLVFPYGLLQSYFDMPWPLN